jgi:hypothetical protein
MLATRSLCSCLQLNGSTQGQVAIEREMQVAVQSTLIVTHLVGASGLDSNGGTPSARLPPYHGDVHMCRSVQAVLREALTLVKHAQGLYDMRSFNSTKASMRANLETFAKYVVAHLGAVQREVVGSPALART